MKKLLLFVALIILISSCVLLRKKAQGRILTYSIDVQIVSDTMEPDLRDYILHKFGDSAKVIYDHRGNIRMNYIGSGKFGLVYHMFNGKEQMSYSKWKYDDTVYYYNLANNTSLLDSMTENRSGRELTLKWFAHDTVLKLPVYQEFHFIQDSLLVNKKLYTGYLDYDFGKMIAISGSIPVKTMVEGNQIRVTRKLMNVELIPSPDESFFRPNAMSPLRKY